MRRLVALLRVGVGWLLQTPAPTFVDREHSPVEKGPLVGPDSGQDLSGSETPLHIVEDGIEPVLPDKKLCPTCQKPMKYVGYYGVGTYVFRCDLDDAMLEFFVDDGVRSVSQYNLPRPPRTMVD